MENKYTYPLFHWVALKHNAVVYSFSLNLSPTLGYMGENKFKLNSNIMSNSLLTASKQR